MGTETKQGGKGVTIMPNNLTDLEIKKALDCCDNCFCENCVYHPKINCREELSHDALDLINRYEEQIATQQAEIERLNLEVNEIMYLPLPFKTHFDNAIETAKAEAYKEFAERLKENYIATFSFKGVVMVEEIDDLLKELVGEDKHFADVSKTNSEIKATAYHECIEKIKKRAEHSSCSVAVNTIADNVLKELEGDNNG